MDILLDELERRCTALFAALSRGEDVPPGPALRTEGLLEAALLLGRSEQAQLDALLAQCYAESMGRPLSADLGEQWREDYPFPQIPLWMQRAPVVPSTAD